MTEEGIQQEPSLMFVFCFKIIRVCFSVDVMYIACGPEHVVAAGSDGSLYSWGCGRDGRLGTSNEENQ